MYVRDTERMKNEFAETVSAMARIAEKKTRSLQNSPSLLKLFVPFQAAVKQGTISVSQGYIFAANLENPKRCGVEFRMNGKARQWKG